MSVFVSRDFELGRKLRCVLQKFFSSISVWLAGGVDRQSRTWLTFLSLQAVTCGKRYEMCKIHSVKERGETVTN